MLEDALGLQKRLIDVRRRIHQHPEVGFQEVETARLVKTALADLGIAAQCGVGKTGVVGRLGQGPPVVGLRADMDALPIQEENDVPYRSRVPGVMHACGHDAHVACLLGAAMLLAEDPPAGEVRFLFQPSEEGQDEEGKSGAMRMVEEGALEGVEAVFALHSFADLEAGWIGVRSGPTCAAVDTAYVTISGRGAHGAYPHRGLDPILMSSHVIMALHSIVSRRIRPLDPAVITVGSIHGGTAANIIPEEVTFSITIRSFDAEVRRTLLHEIDRACGIAQSLGGEYRLCIVEGYPSTVNDEAVSQIVREVAAEMLGAGRVTTVEPTMGAEDFSFYLSQVPGCFFRLGTGSPDTEARVGHNPRFDIDERSLPIGAAMLAAVARRFLEGGSG
jgi:amidohydrolase